MRRNIGMVAASAIGLTVLVGCNLNAGSSGTDQNPTTIRMSIEGYHFVPDHIAVHEGETVRFLITNPTDRAHELFIGTPAEQDADEARHEGASPMEQPGMSRYGYGIFLPAYGNGEFDYHFTVANGIMIGCHLPGHWAAGMRATITVLTK
jgi:uncharacterized cupredoxin-like copper-binding protein